MYCSGIIFQFKKVKTFLTINHIPEHYWWYFNKWGTVCHFKAYNLWNPKPEYNTTLGISNLLWQVATVDKGLVKNKSSLIFLYTT